MIFPEKFSLIQIGDSELIFKKLNFSALGWMSKRVGRCAAAFDYFMVVAGHKKSLDNIIKLLVRHAIAFWLLREVYLPFRYTVCFCHTRPLSACF